MEQLSGMTLAEIFGGVTGIVVFISIFIEITPIKINPVSRFLRWIGRKVNVELMDEFGAMKDEFDALKKDVNKVRDINDERNAVGCRVRILRFGDEVRRGIRHSEESFDQVLSDIDDYERYCKAHKDFKNNKTVATTKKILTVYSQRMDTNDFL